MSTVFPTTKDTLVNPSVSDTLDSPSHSGQHSDVNDAIEAIETKVGIDSSADSNSIDYKINHITIADITDLTASADELNVLDGITSIDTDLSSVSASDDTIPSAKATKSYTDSLAYTWKGDWVTSTSYVLNDVIRNSSAATSGSYICTETHTSGAFATDLAAGKWELFVEDGDITTTTAKASAYLNTAQDNLTDSTGTQVLLDTENYDPGSSFNTTTHQFTAPVTGYYSIKGSVGFNNVITDKRYNAEIRVNGTVIAYSTEVPGAAVPFRLPIARDWYVTQGQTIDLYATSFAGVNTVDLVTGSHSTFLCIHLLST